MRLARASVREDLCPHALLKMAGDWFASPQPATLAITGLTGLTGLTGHPRRRTSCPSPMSCLGAPIRVCGVGTSTALWPTGRPVDRADYSYVRTAGVRTCRLQG